MQDMQETPWIQKIPWSRKWQLTPVFLPGKFHGQRSLAGCSPCSPKESARLSTNAGTQRKRQVSLKREKDGRVWGPGRGEGVCPCRGVSLYASSYYFTSSLQGGMPHAFKVLTSTLATAVRLRWVPTLIVITEGPCPSGLFDSLFFPNVKCEFPFLLNKSVELLKMKILFSLSCTMLTYMQSTS